MFCHVKHILYFVVFRIPILMRVNRNTAYAFFIQDQFHSEIVKNVCHNQT